jgi:intracellular septation protein
MKLFIDFFPIVIFFIAFKVFDIYVATAVAIGTTLLQIAYLKKVHGKVEVMQWVSLGVIVVFGGATLFFHDNTFIKWKPTALYWLMAVSLLVGKFIFRRNLMKTFMGEQLTLPEHAWGVLLLSWVGFLSFMGCLNIYVAYNFDLDTWVNFKLFGSIGLMIVFAIIQGAYLSRFISEEEISSPYIKNPTHEITNLDSHPQSSESKHL